MFPVLEPTTNTAQSKTDTNIWNEKSANLGFMDAVASPGQQVVS